MNQQTMRAFAFGLLAAALALFIYTQATGFSSLSETAMIKQLEKEQYVVLTSAQAAKQKQENEKLQQKLSQLTAENGKQAPQRTKEKTSAKKKKSYTLHIKSGMSSSEAGQLLEKAGIIEDSQAFNDYLTENGYAEKLQLGEHTVHQSMSMKEIAIVLTTK
ncbi:endolytic transglycosylase MltG [Bacillus badius]|uniref:YceG-like family protein n=1 Tax=Bacillus badius TaxID=1455 RepID=A0ABR5AYA4_BACBA|nr:endolytic transglycosylase MltG [Bacillus badius]KIL75303.1 hypothetical protein SD78_2372 [Bacillus badius]KIL79709.1 hypothetical protein SD77_2163 [Bacillus badius]KZR60437.1 hypothetical protein A3781_09710 [Bacillus badius]MED4715199.1 endolytic transglycosylase MltG [Bacillus badius]